jgi:methylated-DNA-protein-cysteine methyltransferase-like protein
VPWHRVVNAAGRIALPPGSRGWREQQRRLRAEGVPVTGGRVPVRFFRDQADELDALLWSSPPPRAAGRGGKP